MTTNPFLIHCDCLFVILSLSWHDGFNATANMGWFGEGMQDSRNDRAWVIAEEPGEGFKVTIVMRFTTQQPLLRRLLITNPTRQTPTSFNSHLYSESYFSQRPDVDGAIKCSSLLIISSSVGWWWEIFWAYLPDMRGRGERFSRECRWIIHN